MRSLLGRSNGTAAARRHLSCFRIRSTIRPSDRFASSASRCWTAVCQPQSREWQSSLRSLLDVLEPFQPKLGRHELTAQEDQWQDDERMTAIGILSGRALGSTAPLALRQQIFAALRQHDLGYYSESVESKFQELLSRMPVSEDYSSFDAFVTPHWYWERMTGDDVLAHEARYRGWVGSAVDHLVESHTTPAAQVARLEELGRRFEGACIKESASFEFVLALAQRHRSPDSRNWLGFLTGPASRNLHHSSSCWRLLSGTHPSYRHSSNMSPVRRFHCLALRSAPSLAPCARAASSRT